MLGRAMKDRLLAGGGTLFAAAADVPNGGAAQDRTAVPRTRASQTHRSGGTAVRRGGDLSPAGRTRPQPAAHRAAAADRCAGSRSTGGSTEPLHWRLLTTHTIADAAAAWEIVGWYQRRWVIEQLFRAMKSQGLQLEDSQIASAERLVKLAAVATKSLPSRKRGPPALDIQLTQGRDGTDQMPASNAFAKIEKSTLSRHSARHLKAAPRGSKITIPSEVSPPLSRGQAVGSMDHRTLGWMELLLQAVRADHLPARQGAAPCDPPRQAARNGIAMRCSESPSAKAGTQARNWVPASAGMTGGLELSPPGIIHSSA